MFDSFKDADFAECKGVAFFYGVKTVANIPLIFGQADYRPSEPVTPGKIVGKIQCPLATSYLV